jgi:uncharacterized protein (DUF488 family)
MTLYTIGHSNRTYDELVAALRAWDVETLVDIRHFTRSRANPQFNAEVLARKLPRDGIDYVEMRDLGGRRGKSKTVPPARNAGWQNASFKNYADYAEGPEFQRALRALLRRKDTCAIMCAEVLWWRCHRRIVTDYVLTRGTKVMHIFTAAKAEVANRTPFARKRGDILTYSIRESPARKSSRAPASRTRSASPRSRAAASGRRVETSRRSPSRRDSRSSPPRDR